MQIKNIILYKDAERVRVLPFDLGKVNIITGESKSGKTALIDIVDYCLGSRDCKIAEGTIKENVHWFSITVVFNSDEELFIARLNPNIRGVQSISEVYIEEDPFTSHPDFDTIQSNSNIENLKVLLSRKINIAENLQVADNNTREPLEVNFKHSRIFCYQPQGLIAQRDYLFYNQTEQFVPQAIKDSLPYFLGAVREDSLKIEQEIAKLKRELNRIIRDKRDAEKIEVEGISRAFSLIEEAKAIGVLNKSVIASTVEEALNVLDSIKDWEYKIEIEPTGENSALKDLIDNRNKLKEELGDLEDTINATQSFVKNNFSYSDEIEHHKIRLESIGLFNEKRK